MSVPALQVRAEPAVVGHDLLARRRDRCPTDPGDAQQLEGLSRVMVSGVIVENSDAVRGLAVAVGRLAQLHVGPEAAGPDLHRQARLGVVAEHAVAGGRGQQLLGPLDGQLVGGQVLGDRRPVLAALEVRAVAADPHHDRARPSASVADAGSS